MTKPGVIEKVHAYKEGGADLAPFLRKQDAARADTLSFIRLCATQRSEFYIPRTQNRGLGINNININSVLTSCRVTAQDKRM